MANTLKTKQVKTRLKKTSTEKSTSEKLQSQINNYKTRLEASGQDTDKRNWLEKALNLPEGQNALFDIFEIIGRPQQALFGAIDAAQTGEDVWEDFKRGLGGAKTTSGGQLLRNAGMGGSGEFNLLDPSSYGEASLSDVLGFGLDLFADPIDLALWASVPATGGATAPVAVGKTAADTAKIAKTVDTVTDVAKAAKAAEKASDIAKAAKVVDTATDAAKAAKVVDTATDVAKTAKAAKMVDTATDIAKIADTATDAAKTAEKTKIVFKPFQKGSKSTLELALGELGKGVKKGAKVGDNLLEKILGDIDTKNIAKYKEAVEKYGASAARESFKITDKLGTYKNLKKSLSSIVDYTKALPGDILKKATKNANTEQIARIQIEDLINKVDNDIDNVARKSLQKQGVELTEDAILKESQRISRDLGDFIEQEYKISNNVSSILGDVSKKNKTIKLTKEGKQTLSNILDDIPLAKGTYEITDDGIKFSDKFLANRNTILKDKKFRNVLENTKIEEAKNYTKKQLKHFKELSKDEDFMNIVNNYKGNYEKATKIIKEQTGIDFSEITNRPGYVKKAKGNVSRETENYFAGKTSTSKSKSFGERKYASRLEAENALQEAGEKGKQAVKVQSERYTKQLSKNKKNILQTELDELIERRNKAKAVFDRNVAKIDDRAAKIVNNNKTLRDTKKLLETKLTDDIIEKAGKIPNTALSEDLFNVSNKVMEQTKQYNDLLEQFYKEGLTDKQLDSLAKRIDKLDVQLKKSNALLESKITRVKATIDDSTIKTLDNVKKTMNKTTDIERKLGLNEIKEKQVLQMKETLRNSYADRIASYDARIEKLEAKLRGIDPAEDAKINKEIKRLAEKEQLLDNIKGEELFDASYTAGLREFMNSSLERSTVARNYNDALLEGTLFDKNVIKFNEDLEKLPNGQLKVPAGWEKVDGTAIYKNIDSFKNLLPENSEALIDFANSVKGKAVYMPKEATVILDVASKTNNEAGAFVKFVNGWNNMFKRYKTFTPGFHLRNITGNASNMYLSGVPMKDIPVYYGKAIQTLDGADDLIRKVGTDGFESLTKAEQKQFRLIQEFAETGFFKSGSKIQELEDIEKAIKKGSKNVPGKVMNKASEISMNLNTAIDNYSRMALYMYAKDNPAYVTKLGKKSAADAVKFALFDPSNMTAAEKKYMRNIVPFYNFTKQNLLFQSSNIIKNTTKYKRLAKAINMAYDGLGENGYYQYQKEGFQLPTPFKDSNGNQLFMKTNLPLSDLGEYMESPVQRSLSSLTPIIKAPIEQVTGQDLFTGQYVNKKSSIERVANYLGVNTISTDLWKKIQAIQDSDKSDNEKWAEILKSMLQNTNEDKVKNNKLYQELEYYQNKVSSLKRQGIDIPTIKELTEQSKSNVNRLKKKRTSN